MRQDINPFTGVIGQTRTYSGADKRASFRYGYKLYPDGINGKRITEEGYTATRYLTIDMAITTAG